MGPLQSQGNFCTTMVLCLKCIASNVILQGHLLFDSNIADKGAALHLVGNSYIYFKNGLRAKFINNTSYSFGGAISAVDHIK